MEADLLYPNQSAYRKRVSCADTIFVTQEVINTYLQEGYDVSTCVSMTCKEHLIQLSSLYI